MTFKDINEKINYIYLGSMIACESIVGIWTSTANRFNFSEMVLIIIGGVAIGYGIGLVVNVILKKLELKNSITKKNNPKTLKN